MPTKEIVCIYVGDVCIGALYIIRQPAFSESVYVLYIYILQQILCCMLSMYIIYCVYYFCWQLHTFLPILAAFPEPASNNGVHYAPMSGQYSVQLPERYIVILDCRPLTFGIQANLSTIQWFRIATRPPVSVVEITDNTSACIFLGVNKTKLYIAELRTARGADMGTEAAYWCSVCGNVPHSCVQAAITVNAESEWLHMHHSTKIGYERLMTLEIPIGISNVNNNRRPWPGVWKRQPQKISLCLLFK